MRVVFEEESVHERRVSLIVFGILDDTLLDGLECFIARQRQRLAIVRATRSRFAAATLDGAVPPVTPG